MLIISKYIKDKKDLKKLRRAAIYGISNRRKAQIPKLLKGYKFVNDIATNKSRLISKQIPRNTCQYFDLKKEN